MQLTISDAHPGMKAAIARVLGAAWHSEATPAKIGRPRARLAEAVCRLQARLPKVAGLLEEAEDDVLIFFTFPAEHWSKLRSTNPPERFNRGDGRRTDVVGISSDDASGIRLVSMLAIEANDEWLVGRPYVSQKSMAILFEPRTDQHSLSDPDPEEVAELLAA